MRRLALFLVGAAMAVAMLATTAYAQSAAQDQYDDDSPTIQPTDRDTHPISPATPDTDWYNTQYTVSCPGIAPRPFTLTIQDGQGYGPPSGDNTQGYIVRATSVVTGDMTGDGGAETAVLLICGPKMANYGVTEVQVFTEGRQLLTLLRPPDLTTSNYTFPPQFTGSPLLIRSGQLITGVVYWSGDDPHCCPSIHRVLIWQWNGNQLSVMQDQQQDHVGQPDNGEKISDQNSGGGSSQQSSGGHNPPTAGETKQKADQQGPATSDKKQPDTSQPDTTLEDYKYRLRLFSAAKCAVELPVAVAAVLSAGPVSLLMAAYIAATAAPDCAATLWNGLDQLRILIECSKQYGAEVCLGLKKPVEVTQRK